MLLLHGLHCLAVQMYRSRREVWRSRVSRQRHTRRLGSQGVWRRPQSEDPISHGPIYLGAAYTVNTTSFKKSTLLNLVPSNARALSGFKARLRSFAKYGIRLNSFVPLGVSIQPFVNGFCISSLCVVWASVMVRRTLRLSKSRSSSRSASFVLSQLPLSHIET